MATKKHAKPIKKAKKLGSVKTLSHHKTLQTKVSLLKSPISIV